MTPDEMRNRTKQFGLRVLRLVDALPRNPGARAIAGQLVRSGTSVGANYRAACRARSAAEFRAKLGIVEEEVDGSAFWIELLIDAAYVKAERATDLLCEAHEITAIVVASIRTSRSTVKEKRHRSRA